MKKLINFLYFTWMLFTCFAAECQTKDGIGPLHIGKTTATFIDSLQADGYTFISGSDNFATPSVTKTISDWGTDTIYKFKNGHPVITGIEKSYMLTGFSLAGMIPEEFFISFYNDTLCSIVVFEYTDKLYNLLKSTYGSPVTTFLNRAKKKCFNHLVNETDSTDTFRSGKKLKIHCLRKVYYDEQCKKNFTRVLEISNPSIKPKMPDFRK